MTIIDTHAHIDQIDDLDAVLSDCANKGVSDVVAMSVDLGSMRQVLDIAARTTALKVWPALGVHPGKVNEPDQPQALEFLKSNISAAAAVGESGLDYWYKWVRKDLSERKKQQDSFAVHLQLAKAHDLPIVIHSRGAWKECLAMAQEVGVTRAVFHWYSGPLEVMERVLAAGYYVSTSPSVGYSEQSRAAMAAAPLENILIETDSPVRFQHPQGEYNACPRDVWKTLEALSDLKNIENQQLLEIVNANARTFFRIPG